MHVSKWGNSLAIRLPKKLVDELELSEGDELAVVKATAGKIAVAKIDRKSAFKAAMKKVRWPAPKSFKFNRDEANER